MGEEELRHLPGRIIEAHEVERLRVARELHDGVDQVMAVGGTREIKSVPKRGTVITVLLPLKIA